MIIATGRTTGIYVIYFILTQVIRPHTSSFQPPYALLLAEAGSRAVQRHAGRGSPGGWQEHQ